MGDAFIARFFDNEDEFHRMHFTLDDLSSSVRSRSVLCVCSGQHT
jgi:hypothetical protein